MKTLKTLLIFFVGVAASQPAALAEDATSPPPGTASPAASALTLREPVGREWTDEIVQVPATPENLEVARLGRHLTDGTSERLYQVIEEAGTIEALVDLPAGKTLDLRFENAPSTATTDLAVKENDSEIILSNRQVAIAIRKHLSGNEGPVRGMAAGEKAAFHGGSTLSPGTEVSEYRWKIHMAGPVRAEVTCEVVGRAGGRWKITFSLQAGEPVVLVSEEFDLGGEARWVMELATGSPLDRIFYRGAIHVTGKDRPGLLRSEPLTTDNERIFTWVPWVRWWEKMRQGKWFGVYTGEGSDLIFVGAREADRWLMPPGGSTNPKEWLPLPGVSVMPGDGGSVALDLPLSKGQRHWLIGLLPKEECLAGIGQNDGYFAPRPQEFVIKSEFPLRRIQEQVLQWDHKSPHPRLFLNNAALDSLRTRPESAELFDLEKLLRSKVFHHDLDEWLAAYWITGDERLRPLLREALEELLKTATNYYTEQGHSYSLGYAPHHNFGYVISAVNLADTVLSFPDLTTEQRDDILARVAFLGYVLERRDHWWQAAGLAANPNMSSMVAGMQIAVGALIPDHPRSKDWIDAGLGELLTQLHEWSDENGAWLEAPHYALAAYDPILAATVIAANAGIADHRYDDKIKRVARWLAKVQTPPDARFLGHRHLPSIGHTYYNDRTNIFSLLGAIWKEKDPGFAAEMMWMHEQSGRPLYPAIGGFFASFVGYRSMLAAMGPKPKAPAYGSELFPKGGAVMRSGFPSDRETMLYVIAGQNHDHYDYDSGSVTIWGKGSILAEDFGYYTRAPKDDHNMLDSPLSDGVRMKIDDFSTTGRLDFFQGTNKGWQRQIVFVKDPDPLGPNYFVINDALRVPAPAIWRMWFDARSVVIDGPAAMVTGLHDVNALVQFVRPAGVTLTTEPRTRSSHGMDDKMKQGQMKRTLQGVLADADRNKGFASVIFPILEGRSVPKIESLEDGRVVVIRGEGWVHHVFLSTKPFAWKQGKLSFEGTVGAILADGDETTLALGAAGRIQSEKQELTSDTARTSKSP